MTYTITENITHSGFQIIKLTEGQFEGVEYYYTEVSFSEGDYQTLSFIYELVNDNGKITQKNQEIFQNLIGDILTNIMEQQLESNDVVYANGTE